MNAETKSKYQLPILIEKLKFANGERFDTLHRNMWEYLSDNPRKTKHDFLSEKGYYKKVSTSVSEYRFPCFDCFACEYAVRLASVDVGFNGSRCDYCPLDKEFCYSDDCFYLNCYRTWKNAERGIRRKVLAKKISKAKWNWHSTILHDIALTYLSSSPDYFYMNAYHPYELTWERLRDKKKRIEEEFSLVRTDWELY